MCRYPHVSVSRKGRTRGPLDDELETLGRARRAVGVVPTYAAASPLALEDDVIVLVPRVMARHPVDRGVPVCWHEVPVTAALSFSSDRTLTTLFTSFCRTPAALAILIDLVSKLA
ncbi:hypothetical protein ABZ554_41940, partial [Streptomyces sp. NPDC020125]